MDPHFFPNYYPLVSPPSVWQTTCCSPAHHSPSHHLQTNTQIPTHPVIIAPNSSTHSLGLHQPSLPEKLVGQLSRFESCISLHFPLFSKINPLVWLPALQQTACCDYSSTSVLIPRELTGPGRTPCFLPSCRTF